MKKPVPKILIYLCLLFLAACSFRPGTNGLFTSDINEEARKEAEKFWATQITKCGDSYYRRREIKDNGSEYFELKEPIVKVAPSQITEADRLNGLEWRGTTSLQLKVSREWDPTSHRWTPWANGGLEAGDLSYPMKKVSGEWSINTKRGGIFDEVLRYAPVDCSKIPQ